MASLFLTWDEVTAEQLPHYCVACAAPATEWADWRLCHSRHLVFSIEHTYVDVTLPVCPEHRHLRTFLVPRVGAKKIDEEGIELSRVSPGFIDAVWDYREEQESRERQRPRPFHKSHPPSADYVDYEEDFPEPRPHRGPPRRDARSNSGFSFGRLILIALAVLFLGPFALLMLFMLLGLLMGFAI